MTKMRQERAPEDRETDDLQEILTTERRKKQRLQGNGF